MKKKLVYISPECFSDVDFPIIKELNKVYELTWIIIFNDPKTCVKPKFSSDYVIEFCNKNNIRVIIETRPSRISSPKTILFCVDLLKKIKSVNSHYIYVESFVDIYFVLLSYLLLPIDKSIIAIHDVVAHIDHVDWLKDFSIWLQRKLFKKFHFFSISQRDIFDLKFKNKRSFVAPLALKSIDNNFEISSKEYSYPVQFLFWGNIRRSKGVDILIDAAEELYRRGYRNYNVKIVGACSDWEFYQQRIVHPEIFEINTSFLPNEEIPSLLKDSHYLVLPYKDVTQSGPLMYSFFYNLPTIVSNHKGFEEFVKNNNTGFIFKNNDFNSLSDVMEKQLNSNKETYNNIKSSLLKCVEVNFNINKIIEKYIDGFNDLVG